MYISNSTLEKLVEILHKKVNDATAMETISRICDVLTSGMCAVPEGQAKEPTNQVPLSSLSSEGEQNEGGNDGDDDTDDNRPDTSRSDKNSSIASDSKITLVLDNSVNLSGPVTDL
ncbi:uncharacterized protein LOC114255466 [Monomorium pharaonis]|uniref:uncharacterized protein LOC114255466 n=1 Tax=Monomorium pharaonis TaxID=307658 RepID=UPI00102E1550|nr:uncharacterized protein LOC114255466 [Monomorium pharaonis]